MYQDESYPFLPRLAYAARWLDGFTSLIETLILSLSGLLLTIGISFSMFDFLTGGTALNDPYVFGSWALIQTIAIDAQFISMWFKSKLAFRERKFFPAIGYALLGSLLGFVTFGANAIPALQSSLHVNFEGALNQLGLNATYMVYVRSVVVIILAVIAAYNRTVLTFNSSGEIQKNNEQSEQKKSAKNDDPQTKKREKKERKKFIQFPRIFGKKEEQKIAPQIAEKSVDPQEKIEQKNEQTEEQKVDAEDEIFIAEIPLRIAENLSSLTRKFDEEETSAERGFEEQTSFSVMTENAEVTQAQERNTDPELAAPQKNDLNRPVESAEPLEPERSADDAGPDTGDLTGDEDESDSNRSISQFTSSAPSDSSLVRVESRGYTREELYNHPRILAAFKNKRSDTRRRIIDKAWMDGTIVVKKDGKARENAVTSWIKTLA